MSIVEIISGLLVVVGLAGIVIQILPGTILVLAGIALWATERQTGIGWVVLALAVLAIGAAAVVKYVLAGRTLKRAEVPNRSLVVGGLAGVIGFFVIPVIGLPLLFILGVFAAEQLRLRDRHRAWRATKAAIKATGITILIELAGALVAVGFWVAGLVWA